MGTFKSANGQRRYERRILACLAGTLLLLIALVQLLPAPDIAPAPDTLYSAQGQELIEIEEIMPTQQEQAPPPPSPPLPIVVPDDVPLPDDDLEWTDNYLEVPDPNDDPEYVEGDPDARPDAAPAASRSARLVRVVEPDYPQEARRRDIQARLVIQLHVSAEGLVQEATIMERYIVDTRAGTEERVARLGYGIEESALEAARRVQFRPAMNNGEAVSEVTTYTMTLGQ